MTDSIQHLIGRCLAGEEAAVRELVRRYQQLVFSLCYRMLGQREDAEDAAQETLVRAIRSLANYDASRSFEPWLLAIAANRCRTAMAVRMRRRDSTVLTDNVPDKGSNVLAVRHLEEEVEAALDRLRPEYRGAFVLFHKHEKSYAEIAEVFDRPLGTIKTWVHRARQELIGYLRARDVKLEPCHELRNV